MSDLDTVVKIVGLLTSQLFLTRQFPISKLFSIYLKLFFESLILAQDERWRCALGMQVAREFYLRIKGQRQTGE